MSDRAEGVGYDVPNYQGSGDGLTPEQDAELERRGELGFRLVSTMPREQFRQGVRDLVEELEEFIEECRAANAA